MCEHMGETYGCLRLICSVLISRSGVELFIKCRRALMVGTFSNAGRVRHGRLPISQHALNGGVFSLFIYYHGDCQVKIGPAVIFLYSNPDEGVLPIFFEP